MFRVGRKPAVVVLATLAVASVTFSAPASARKVPNGPEGDAFYQPPDPLPKAKAGTLIRAQPIEAPSGARAWRVLYHSRTALGDDIVVSGMVVKPSGAAPKGGRPIVSWAHGTTGTADSCVPSKSGNPANIPFLLELLDAGYVVVATDYEGLGPPGLHPFLVGQSEGKGVLDVARAARQLPTGASRDLLVYGHSQGGHAALFAGELASSYAPELELLGVAAGAPPADIELILPAAASIPAAANYFIEATGGFHAAYPQADPADFLTPEALAKLPLLEELCSGDIGDAFRAIPEGLTTRSPGDVPPWPKLMRKNSAGNRKTEAPVLVFQGGADPLVLPALTDAFARKACDRGDTLDYRVYAGEDHVGALFAARDDILAFFAARLDGDTPTSTCAT